MPPATSRPTPASAIRPGHGPRCLCPERVRRGSRLAAAVLLAMAAGPAQAAAEITSFEALAEHAQRLAQEPHQSASVEMPDTLADLDYDAYRDIRFETAQSIWRQTDLPVELQLFHLGLYYDAPVQVNLITEDGVQPIDFGTELFDYGRTDPPESVPEDFGFAGFRLHYPLNTAEYKDELIVFQGASYFRALGAGQQFGLSARGLAIDTAESSGEEFPVFREFWVEWPRRDATSFRILALLDSDSVTGAYAFHVTPGETTTTRVTARLFPRETMGKVGIAPLTSMFYFGELRPRPRGDFRPEVHDSDGLSIQTGSQWVWRPLNNPATLSSNGFASTRIRGFGLMQRDRQHAHYADLEADYESRPSAWVEVHGDWGPGRVELIQIPATNEVNDNIVAYWVPEAGLQPGDTHSFEYTIHWEHDTLTGPPGGRVVATRIADATEETRMRFVVDFAGGALADLPPDAEVQASFSQSGGFAVSDVRAEHNAHTGGWRVAVQGTPEEDIGKDIDLRLSLQGADQAPLSEVWTYTFRPGE